MFKSAFLWLIRIIEMMLVLRAIFSWMPMQNGNPLYSFFVSLTEPIVGPVRNLLYRLNIGRNTFMDVSVLVSFILLSFIRGIIVRL